MVELRFVHYKDKTMEKKRVREGPKNLIQEKFPRERIAQEDGGKGKQQYVVVKSRGKKVITLKKFPLKGLISPTL